MSRPVVWRDLRGRLTINVLLCALSAVAVLTAVLGPLLVRAISQSTLQDAVAAGGPERTAITVSLDLSGEELSFASGLVPAVFTPVQQGPAARIWQAPQLWTESTDNVAWAPRPRTGKLEATTRVRFTDDSCAGMVITDGRCPAEVGQALISSRDARRSHLVVGSTLTFRCPGVPERRLTVVGTYDANRADAPLTRPETKSGTTAAVTADPLVLTAAQLAELPLRMRASGRLVLEAGLSVQDEPLARQSVIAVSDALLEESSELRFDSQLVDFLDRVDAQTRDAQVLVAVTEVQALALAVFSLAVVLQRLARSRTAEWGIGRLRGVPRRRWLASIYAEPALALISGVPVGVVAGVLVAQGSVASNLRPGTPVEIWRWPVLVAALATALASLLALLAVSVPSVRRPLAELIQERSESRRLSRLAAAAQAVVVLSAALTGYELRVGGVLNTRGPQLGLLAPALFALALALLAVRMTVLVVRGVTSRPPRTLTALVVGRQAARAPSALNPAIVIAVGVALAVFASQVLLLSVRNQGLRATAVVGADSVLQVAVPAGSDLRSAVRAADPSGQVAMAVQETAARSDSGLSRIVAVDTTRLAAVSSWSPAWSGVGDLTAALHPPAGPPITLRGTRVEVTVSAVRVTPGKPSIAGTSFADPVLTLTLDTGARWKTVSLGPVSRGPRLRGKMPCPKGCRIVGFGLVSAPGAPYEATVSITGVATDVSAERESRGWLRQQGRWHTRLGDTASPDPVAKAVPTASGAGLLVQVSDVEGGNAALVAPSDAIDPLPAVLAPGTPEEPFAGIADAAYGRGLNGQPQLLHIVGHASVLPRSLGDGVLVDLGNAARLSDPAENDAVSEVWLSGTAPADMERALTRAGLRIQSREDLDATRAALEQQPTTRAAAVARYLGCAALLLTLLALVAARVADVVRRRVDWRSLRDAGLTARSIRRLALVEIAVPALLGTALGVISGMAAVTLAAARLPLVDLSTPGPPLDLRLSWPAAALVGLGVGVLILVGAFVGAALETRLRPGRSP